MRLLIQTIIIQAPCLGLGQIQFDSIWTIVLSVKYFLSLSLFLPGQDIA